MRTIPRIFIEVQVRSDYPKLPIHRVLPASTQVSTFYLKSPEHLAITLL